LLLLLLALLLPPAGLIGLLVMQAVERRLDDADSGPGQVTASDLSWLAAAQAQAQRAPTRPPAPANPHWTEAGLGCRGNRRSSR